MQEHGSAATAMLGLAGFNLIAVSEYVGELEQAVETTAVIDFCRSCGAQARLHDRRPSWVRDPLSGGHPVTLVLGEADLALRRGGVPARDVDGDLRAHRSTRIDDGTGRGEASPAGR